MKIEICDKAFEVADPSNLGIILTTEDTYFSLYDINEEQQGISIRESSSDEFLKFFQTFNCTRLYFSFYWKSGIINLINTGIDSKIRELSFISTSVAQPLIKFEAHKNYFPKLVKLRLEGGLNFQFPSLKNSYELKWILIDYDKKNFSNWTSLINKNQIIDLRVNSLDSKHLFSLLGDFTSLIKLTLANGKFTNLDGIENFNHLKTLNLTNCRRLSDATSILNSKSLENLKVEMVTKIKNWDFLAKNKNLRCVSLETAESIEFFRDLPNIDFFFCKKVLDRKNKSFLFSKTHEQDKMTKDGIEINWWPTSPIFLEDLV
jgi:hypothetical protein